MHGLVKGKNTCEILALSLYERRTTLFTRTRKLPDSHHSFDCVSRYIIVNRSYHTDTRATRATLRLYYIAQYCTTSCKACGCECDRKDRTDQRVDKVDHFIRQPWHLALRRSANEALDVIGDERGERNGQQRVHRHHSGTNAHTAENHRADNTRGCPLGADRPLCSGRHAAEGCDQVGGLSVGFAHLARKGVRQLSRKRGDEAHAEKEGAHGRRSDRCERAERRGGSRAPDVLGATSAATALSNS